LAEGELERRFLELYRKIRKERLTRPRKDLAGWVYEVCRELNLKKDEARGLRDNLIPAGTKRYKGLTVFECSQESGICPIYMLSGIKNLTFFYLCSPFLKQRDIQNWRYFARMRSKGALDFKVLTDGGDFWDPDVRFLKVHAKFIVTDNLAMISSSNLDSLGMSVTRKDRYGYWASKEIGVVIRIPEVIEDLKERFLWWWEEAEWNDKSLSLSDFL
jgi:phosphatidylserine/phosphatidylglycerophosphate/cardiolipin synthase-like enzyme